MILKKPREIIRVNFEICLSKSVVFGGEPRAVYQDW